MFYEGDLQSGITKALQESKLVACFVTDGDEESHIWETDFLQDQSIKSSLSDETVLLRLVAGSQEAGYLAAIFPLPKTPSIVIIHNGQLKEYLTSGVSKEDFLRRIRIVFDSCEAVVSTEDEQPHSTASGGEAGSNSNVTSASLQSTQAGAVTSSTLVETNSAEELPAQVIQDPRTERSATPEAHKREQDAKEKLKRIAEARRASLEDAPDGSKKTADIKYALMQKKRQQDAREERARILKRVEDDKVERREREVQRKAQIQAIDNSQNRDPPPAAFNDIVSSALHHSKECALQIRLFDGSTIRSRFSAQGSLRADVRPWIDKQQTIDIPYTFKLVLTPLPNKNISISDEEQSLRSQGLAPSSTLILIPVHGYTSAYEDSGATGYVPRGFAAGYGLVSSGIRLVTGVLGSILGGGAPQPSPPADSTPIPGTLASNINVRTLEEQNRTEDHQLYNGNALNFEPRKDDEDKKDE